MSDIEKMLEGIRAGKAPVSLDRKVSTLLAEAATARTPLLNASIPVWVSLAACVISAIAGFSARPVVVAPSEAAREAVVHVVQPSPELIQRLDRSHRPPPYPLSADRHAVPAPRGVGPKLAQSHDEVS
jgi:hypothetical protein